jgi:elongation factor 3
MSSYIIFFILLTLLQTSRGPDEVRTFYVEHEIDSSDAETSALQSILSDKHVLCEEKEVIQTLDSLGFTDERQAHVIGSLSGGRKMKLALACAMLFRADILLLDEPTNHLDVVNIAWLEGYLTSLKTCTSSEYHVVIYIYITNIISVIVSHDSGFLNNSITDVLHLNRFKIRRYRGNLEAIVKAVPEAKSYYTLEAAKDYKFKLLDPPLLDGVKIKEKSLLKMHKVGFQYPSQQVQRSPTPSSPSHLLQPCPAPGHQGHWHYRWTDCPPYRQRAYRHRNRLWP